MPFGYAAAVLTVQTRVAVADVEAALHAMREVDGVRAFAFILDYDDAFGDCVANIVFICGAAVWDEATSLACQAARSAAWEALSPLKVVPNLHCRTTSEHAELSRREPAWTMISSTTGLSPEAGSSTSALGLRSE